LKKSPALAYQPAAEVIADWRRSFNQQTLATSLPVDATNPSSKTDFCKHAPFPVISYESPDLSQYD